MRLSDAIDDRDDGESPWPAFADLLAATTLLFLVLFAVVALPALVRAAESGKEQSRLQDVFMRIDSLKQSNRVVVTREQGYVLVRIAGDATFPYEQFERDSLALDGQEILRDFAAAVVRDSALLASIDQIQVVGHTSVEGEAHYNRMLSAKRAVSVATFLIEQGLSPCKVTALGRGLHYPLIPGSGVRNPDDRRIELEIRPIVPKSDTRRCVETRGGAAR